MARDEEATVTGADLRELFGARPPIASIYLDDGQGTEPERTRLHELWDRIRDTLHRHGFPDHVQDLVEDRLFGPDVPDRGNGGRALIADCDGVLLDRRLPHHPDTEGVRVSSLPYLLPLVEQEAPRDEPITGDDAADRFLAEHGRRSGLAADGVAAVTAALRHENAETVLFGEVADVPVLASLAHPACVGTGPPDLAEVGCADGAVRRADEALPCAAVAAGADLVRVGARLPLRDGVGVLRRHP